MQQYKRHVAKPKPLLHTITVTIISRVQRAIPLTLFHSALQLIEGSQRHTIWCVLLKRYRTLFPKTTLSPQNFSCQLLARLRSDSHIFIQEPMMRIPDGFLSYDGEQDPWPSPSAKGIRIQSIALFDVPSRQEVLQVTDQIPPFPQR